MKYLKLKMNNFYVKIIDEHNNLHFRFNDATDTFAIDFNGSPNVAYKEMIECTREEFDENYKKVVEKLNKLSSK